MLWLFQTHQPPQWLGPWTSTYFVTPGYRSRYIVHTEQGTQFQSQLMEDLCRIGGGNQSRTTPYYPQGKGVVERNNRMLVDALRSLLLGRGLENGMWCCRRSCDLTAAHHTPACMRPQTSWCWAERPGTPDIPCCSHRVSRTWVRGEINRNHGPGSWYTAGPVVADTDRRLGRAPSVPGGRLGMDGKLS